MPRRTAEERAASFYRARRVVPAPPRGMNARARRAWRDIIASKSPDYFDAGSLELLRLYCEASAGAFQVAADLAGLAPGSVQYTRACANWKMLANGALASAKALRLTVQNAVHTQSAKITERSGASNVDNRLLGGRDAA
jgi:hypothetical protein